MPNKNSIIQDFGLPHDRQHREEILLILNSYRKLDSKLGYGKWVSAVIEKIIALAQPDAAGRNQYLPDSALCSLCGCDSTTIYQKGFRLPDGLRSHLSGRGNVRRCNVMKNVTQSALLYWNG